MDMNMVTMLRSAEAQNPQANSTALSRDVGERTIVSASPARENHGAHDGDQITLRHSTQQNLLNSKVACPVEPPLPPIARFGCAGARLVRQAVITSAARRHRGNPPKVATRLATRALFAGI